MDFLKALKIAYEDDSGAVTVDWVVLAAAIVVLGTGVVSVISPGLTAGSTQIRAELVSANSN